MKKYEIIILISLLIFSTGYILKNELKTNKTNVSFLKHVHRTNKFHKDTYSTVMEADIYQVIDSTGHIHIVVVPVVDWIKED
jgi:hypothetical protein